MDVQLCRFKTIKGLFLKPIYNKKNWKPRITNSDSTAAASITKLQSTTEECVVDLQGSKGVAPKKKFKLKPIMNPR